jgi:hypothetical protein
MFLVRSDYGLRLSIVESAAVSHEMAKQRFSILASNGPPTVDHVSQGSALREQQFAQHRSALSPLSLCEANFAAGLALKFVASRRH